MVFSSSVFLFVFLPLLLICHFIAGKRYQNYVLLLFSLVFYAWVGPQFLLLLFFVAALAYTAGLLIEKADGQKRKKFYLVAAIAANVALLGYFKYTVFFIKNINRFLNMDFIIPNIVLPIGISFFTFQALSYMIDVYLGKTRAQKNPFYILVYISMFPQITSGPIIRYPAIENEIFHRKANMDDFVYGVERFIIGLAKKVIIANNVGELSGLIYESAHLDTSMAWLGALAYMLQIYFDFSAYSDMAIGIARMLGFRFAENFNYPYIATSITDFWRRWHISLSTWFRDYIYIPLGGNRKGIKRQILNMLVVWALTGLWHGASWNFISWGLYYFALLAIEKVFLGKLLQKLPKLLQWLYTMICVLFGWVIFNIPYMSSVLQTIYRMLTFQFTEAGLTAANIYVHKYGIYLVLGCIFSLPVYPWLNKILSRESGSKTKDTLRAALKYFLLLGLFAISILYLVNSTYSAFLYFQF